MSASNEVFFLGFRRPDGTVGVRNYVAVIPSVFCANSVAQQIVEPFEDALALCHPLGCSHVGRDLEIAARTLKGLGRNPNVGAVLVVGLGREHLTPSELAEAIAESGKPAESVLVHQDGAAIPAIEEGRAAVGRLVRLVREQAREECSIQNLTVAVDCEDSDPSSLFAANPSIGMAIDVLVTHGATAVFSRSAEFLAAEDVLLERAYSPDIAAEVKAMLQQARERLLRSTVGVSGPERAPISAASVASGLTTVTERSLGSLSKSGSGSIVGVLQYGERIPRRQGVFLMDGPHRDAESVTGMVAGGAQVLLFSTGRGTRAKFPIMPVITITGNPGIYDLFEENVDVDAGVIVKREMGFHEVGQRILDTILAVASGSRAKGELSTQRELFAIWQGL